MSREHILIVDDEPDIRNLISDILSDEGYSVATAANGEEANSQLTIKTPQLILLDIWMPDIDGISLMKGWLEKKQVTAPIVMMSGHGTVETAVEATRLGARDFIEKPLSLAKLLQTVSENITPAGEEESTTEAFDILEPIGNSAATNQLRASLNNIYQSHSHLFIEGDYGTGKNSIAVLIHHRKFGTDKPVINMDAAFCGEDFNKKLTAHGGYFDKSMDGTLIINNIDCLTRDQQNLLLSFIKFKQYSNFGQNNIQPLNSQIIAISKQDMNQLITENEFSSELYSMLAEVKLYVPSLSERQEDIPELVNFYVNTLPDNENTPYRKISFAAQNLLRNHHWKNNIVDLKNTVRQLLMLGGDGEISKDEVEQLLIESSVEDTPDKNQKNWYSMPLREAREAFEKDYLLYQLQAVEGRVGKLAEVAGMERTHLYRKLRALNINPKDVIKS